MHTLAPTPLVSRSSAWDGTYLEVLSTRVPLFKFCMKSWQSKPTVLLQQEMLVHSSGSYGLLHCNVTMFVELIRIRGGHPAHRPSTRRVALNIRGLRPSRDADMLVVFRATPIASRIFRLSEVKCFSYQSLKNTFNVPNLAQLRTLKRPDPAIHSLLLTAMIERS